MLRRHSVSPQTAFICDSVTDLPTSSVGETLRLASQKANRSGLFVERRSRAKQRGGAEDVEIEQHGVAHVVTQKLRISYTKGARVFFLWFRRQKRSPHAAASSQSVALGRVVFPQRCRRSAALFLPVVSRSLQEKHCSI